MSVSLDRLRVAAKTVVGKAEDSYLKLKSPRICSRETFIAYWVREELGRKFASKSLRKLDLKDPQDPHSQTLSALFYLLPFGLYPHLNKRLFNAPFSGRQKIWQEFDLPVVKINTGLKKLVLVREKEAVKKGSSSFTDSLLEINRIPRSVYLQFIKNIDLLIKKLNQQLPETENLPSWFYSELNLPCFVCRLSSFPFRSRQEVFSFAAGEYPILKKFRYKIKIKIGNKHSFTRYRKESDSFEVNLGKEPNIRYQTISLIHELGHVVSLLNTLRQGEDLSFTGGKYEGEKQAIKIEMALLKKISTQFYRAVLGEVLLFNFRKILFEIELYQNPYQDLSRLYAQTFNRCFLKAQQKNNPLYILDERIILSPFANLPHTIAWYEILSKPKR